MTYCVRCSSCRAFFARATGYVGGWTRASLPSMGTSRWRYVSATRVSSPMSCLMNGVIDCFSFLVAFAR